MDFIIENYLWFGIVGVILLMALIGFLAEKTNFIVTNGEQMKKPKKRKNKVEKEVIDNSEVVEEPVVEETKVESTDLPAMEEPLAMDTTTANDEMLDFSSTTSAEPVIESAPLNINNDWGQINNTPENLQQPFITETGEDLSQPLGSTTNTEISQGVDANSSMNETNEDVWKF